MLFFRCRLPGLGRLLFLHLGCWLIVLICPLEALTQVSEQETGLESLPPTQLADTSLAIFLAGDPDLGFQLARAAAKRASGATEKYFTSYNLFRLYMRERKLPEAKRFIREALGFSRQTDSLPLYGKALFSTGFLFIEIGNSDSGMYYLNEALKVQEILQDSTELVRIHLTIGYGAASIGNYQMAVPSDLKAVELAEQLRDSTNWAIGLQNLGAIYTELDKNDSALIVLKRAVELNKGSVFPYKTIIPLTNIARLYSKIKDTVSYRKYCLEALELSRKYDNIEGKMQAELGMAEYYNWVGGYDSAMVFAQNAWAYAQKYQNPFFFGYIMVSLIEANKGIGDFETALCWSQATLEHDMQSRSEERSKYAEELKTRYEAEKKDGENRILKASQSRLQRQQKITYLIAVLLALVMLVALVVMARANRRRKSYNDVLAQKNQEIELRSQDLESKNKALRELNHEKDALVSIVAHDLKAPLAKIRGLSDMMGTLRDEPAQFEKVQGLINRVVDDGKNIINELVFLTSLDKNSEGSPFEPTEVVGVVRQSVEGFQAPANNKDIALTLETDLVSFTLESSPDYLSRILDNLISNAIKFSMRNKAVKVRLSREVSCIHLEVIDQGPGIAPEDHEKLFEKFVRLGNRPTAGESSTGLGLSIVKALVEKIGGQIAVRSALGQGATFQVTLPIPQ